VGPLRVLRRVWQELLKAGAEEDARTQAGTGYERLVFHSKRLDPRPVFERRAKSCQSSEVSLDLTEV